MGALTSLRQKVGGHHPFEDSHSVEDSSARSRRVHAERLHLPSVGKWSIAVAPPWTEKYEIPDIRNVRRNLR